MCKHSNVFSLPVLMDECLITYIQRSRGGGFGNRWQIATNVPSVTFGARGAVEDNAVDRSHTIYPQRKLEARPGLTARRVFTGEHIGKVTPVSIPNTVVKLSEPMIVPKARK